MSYTQFDQNHIWHPYNRLPSAQPALAVKSANGSLIHLETGETLLDAMSSWWSAIHGYNHPTINAAAIEQIQTLSHIMFGGFTHQPAIELAQKLIQLTPPGLEKVFFADSGSVAVEVALKVALQYWKARKQPQKSTFLALQHAYHGDTFGAMSVCDPVHGMHHLFAENLMPNLFAPAPLAGLQINENADIIALEQLFAKHHATLAAFILEPIVQGAGGMRFYRPAYLKRARELCDQYDVLLIADEIATGFGRTGKLFACEWANISPDIMCIGKGLTGGYMTLAAMLCTTAISDTISTANPGLLMHGPTFMANPLACRIASASIDVLTSYDWQRNIQTIQHHLADALLPLNSICGIKECRVLGAIGVIELEQDGLGPAIQQAARQKGVWLRPFGNLIYTMPAYTISHDELTLLTEAMVTSIKDVLSSPSNSEAAPLVSQFV
ncbi:MAG: adenosylmethionine--8-amino-7-oxononanoate transaminase [Thiomicrospira sp.]